MSIKKKVVLFIVICIMVSICGCSSQVKRENESAHPLSSKLAVSGPMTQILVYGMVPELMAGISSNWSDAAKQYIPAEYLQLPNVGQLYGSKGSLNLEEVLSIGPDIVFDIGEHKDGVEADMESLTQQTGIKFVHIDATLETFGDAYRTLGTYVGMEERGAEYGAYCDGIYKRIKSIMEKVGDKKVRTLYCLGEKGINVIAKGSYQAEVIDMMTDNQAVVENPSAKGTGNEVDMEQIIKWDPDFIIFEPDTMYEKATADPLWSQLNAIKNAKYVEVPMGPYNWLGFPPSVQRYLGMLWLAETLYPEYCDFELKEEVTRYFKMFYHIELSDSEYEKLLKNSKIK